MDNETCKASTTLAQKVGRTHTKFGIYIVIGTSTILAPKLWVEIIN